MKERVLQDVDSLKINKNSAWVTKHLSVGVFSDG